MVYVNKELLGDKLNPVEERAKAKVLFRELFATKADHELIKGEYYNRPVSLGVRLGVSRRWLVQWARELGVLDGSPLAAYTLADHETAHGNAPCSIHSTDWMLGVKT